MTRNWYNQIPHPTIKTKRETTFNIYYHDVILVGYFGRVIACGLEPI